MQENSCSPCQQTDVLDFIVIKTDNFNAEGIDSCIIKFAEEFSNPGYNIYSPRIASKSKKSNPKDIYEEDAYWAVDHYLLHINESKNFIILCNPDDLELTRNLIKTLPEEALLKLKGAYTKDKDCSFSPFYDSKSNN